jgi:CDP-diacylglycerol---glycerol-3-phosphate 3-phosphatidyltransferase
VSSPFAGDNWNVPNVLTGLRIVLVPVFGYALLQDGGDSVGWRLAATAVFAVAMVTDKVDGDIARSRGLVTNFGKIADPIADKAMTGMAFIGLSVVGDVWWWVTIVVLLREWSVTLLRLSILSRVVVAAAQSGKVKTVLQAFALTGLCLPLRQVDAPLHDTGVVLFYVFQVALVMAVAMTLWSGFEFFRDVWRQRATLRAT